MNQTKETNTAAAYPLAVAESGATVVVRRIAGGRGMHARLAAMGLAQGVEVAVVRNDRGGPLVVGVMGSRFMIGRGIAQNIWVS